MSSCINKTVEQLRVQLPRLGSLHQRFAKESLTNFFYQFPDRLFAEKDTSVTLEFYKNIEYNFSFIPDSQWESFCAKVASTVEVFEEGRHWQKLHDVFNEAIGARVLVETYSCTELSLLPECKNTKSCDWFGSKDGKHYYIEVKTLNHSDAERRSWLDGGSRLTHTCDAPAGFINKAMAQYNYAREQLMAMDPAEKATKLVLFVVNIDRNFFPFEKSAEELLEREFREFEETSYKIILKIFNAGKSR